jgi:prepilin-type N-terminal cleavage/methylation domain-containing protein
MMPGIRGEVGTAVATEFAVIFYNRHRTRAHLARRGFSLVEASVAIALIGVGVAVTLGALTKFNSIAATSRNATGASALLMNQVDLFLSMSPFNPQPSKSQIPKDPANNPPTYDMTVGTHTIAYQDPSTGVVSTQTDPWPVYREPSRWTYTDAAARTSATGFISSDIGQLAFQSSDLTYWRLQTTAPSWTQDTSGGIIVRGTMTSTVTDISPVAGVAPYIYKVVFTLGYTFGSRDGGKSGPIWNATRNRWEYQVSMSAVRTSDI